MKKTVFSAFAFTIYLVSSSQVFAGQMYCQSVSTDSKVKLAVVLSSVDDSFFTANSESKGKVKLYLKEGKLKSTFEFPVHSYYHKAFSTNIFSRSSDNLPSNFAFWLTRRSLNNPNQIYDLELNKRAFKVQCKRK